MLPRRLKSNMPTARQLQQEVKKFMVAKEKREKKK
jgi:hypothetical protein